MHIKVEFDRTISSKNPNRDLRYNIQISTFFYLIYEEKN